MSWAASSVLVGEPDNALCHEVVDVIAALGQRVEVTQTGEETLAATARLSPRLVVIGVEIRNPTGFEVLHTLRLRHGQTPAVAVLAAAEAPNMRDEVAVMLLGADDYFTRPLQRDSFAARIVRLLARPAAGSPAQTASPVPAALTPREREVLALLVEGERVAEIAALLCITRKTAATHIERILAKLGAHTQAQAVAFAIRDRILL